MNINLFSLTGFANPILQWLIDNNHNVVLYTRKEPFEYPYYKCEQADNYAKNNNIEIHYIDEDGTWDVNTKADINLVATFHRILKNEHYKMAKVNLNIHPSLLPSYKGPNPFYWIIKNREKRCGLSVHILNDSIDSGDIIFQQEYKMLCLNEGELRHFLSKKLEHVLKYIIINFPKYKTIKSLYKDSYYPSPKKEIV